MKFLERLHDDLVNKLVDDLASILELLVPNEMDQLSQAASIRQSTLSQVVRFLEPIFFGAFFTIE